MQPCTLFTLKKIAALLLVVSCVAVQAAELGEPALRSFIGQPLAAEIELTALAPDEVSNLQVRLASPDVYRGANIGMDPVLQTLTMTVVRREQRQFLRLVSSKPVTANHLHLFLELGGGVRAVTLWLTADPAPPPPPPAPAAPPPMPVPAMALPVPAAAKPQPVPAAAAKPAPASETAPSAAPPAAKARTAMPPPATSVPPPATSVPPPATSVPSHATSVPPHAASVPRLPSAAAAPAASCAPAPSGEQSSQCLALDRQNLALNAKLAELEGKIKVLQEGLSPGAKSAQPVASPAAAAPVALKPKPKRLAPAVAEKKPEAVSNWLSYASTAALVFSLAALAIYLFRRRKKTGEPAVPSKYWVLLRKPFRRKKSAEEAPLQEPSLELEKS